MTEPDQSDSPLGCKFDNPLPGVPAVESPFFERLFSHADSHIRRVACDLHVNGFAVIDFPDADLDQMASQIGAALSSSFDLESWRRDGHSKRSGVRIQDAWRTEPNVRRIAANAQILQLLSTLYGRRAWPFQTLNFPVGTQQNFHSDSVHFSSMPERFMCGVWVALEDVDVDNGPLVYYPGTHKWPIFTNEHLGMCVAETDRSIVANIYEQVWSGLVDAAGIKPAYFHARKGQALIWAANLLHGGAEHRNPDRTRWSQVTHYYFDNCAYYTPMHSDPAYGHIAFREQIDIATGNLIPNRYAGHLVPREFINATNPNALRLPAEFDPVQYYAANPDVREAGVDAGEHWMRHGRFEQRRLAP